ncbi:hypothetical protein F5876DRAFT_76107 [Lentinula aff. lateritia]|uniref:Uncharacterized protein n=1 Tax=Lentinula aff. lateritia TaxID=2804960 RepID=A0ACC1U3G7_9AGAR|nr:hypothetical protein F5876DRAFT_76107 [Lentinula aff. lateritia]
MTEINPISKLSDLEEPIPVESLPFGIKLGDFHLGPHLQIPLSPTMPASQTTTTTSNNALVGSIPFDTNPPALTRPMSPSATDEE